MDKLLIIGDPHAHPNYDNDRFHLLANLISIERPDTIVCMGDFNDAPSLSSYDKKKKSFEGRRYKLDIEASNDALGIIATGEERVNLIRRASKKALYRPTKWMLGGNHFEGRVDRVTNDNPELDGTISIDDVEFDKYGWEYIPFRVPLILGGIAFCHWFPSGDLDRAIGGINLANTLINKNHMSSVVGHSHRLDFAEQSRPDKTKVFGLSAGCFAHPDMVEGWNLATERKWWRGVIILEGVKNGYFKKFRTISLESMEEEYGRA